jgi:ubiquinone/menaquinone biosynthesis C-methylase UbiE
LLDNSFDRVICSCVLIHVDQPFAALMEMNRVARPGGTISFYLACEPGVLLRLMRFFVSAPKMHNLDVPYALLNALSHRNNVGGLIEMSRHVFKDSQIKFRFYPFHLKSWNFSTHVIVNIVKS